MINFLKLIRDPKKGIFYGFLERAEKIPVYLDVNTFTTRHIAILAQSGGGKSYDVGIIIEELLDKEIPVIVFDPHGEYYTLKYPNDDEKDLNAMDYFNISPKGYKNIIVYAPDPNIAPTADKKLQLRGYNLSLNEILELLPYELKGKHIGIIAEAIDRLEGEFDLNLLKEEIKKDENDEKWEVIAMLEQVIAPEIFTQTPVSLEEIVRIGGASIINLRGTPQWLKEVIVNRLIKDLFYARMLGKVPPFLIVLEEAHNFVPSGKKTICSEIIKTVASEGRKFGVGLCVVTQRAAKIDEDVLSQCGTKIIKRISSKADLEAILTSAETLEREFLEEIQRLPPWMSLVTGLTTEVPLFVRVRVRKSKHGGVTPNILKEIRKWKEKNERS